MRLTLRTLLAYLDDILEPAQAKEIGAKITESDFAASLTNRIRDVMRQRRLTAPEIDGPSSGVDPNTISEYLDNTLSPDLVADLEKICLESDMHLAEVAASHQILTLVLGEPVEINPQTRERMYSLAPSPKPPEPAQTTEAASLATYAIAPSPETQDTGQAVAKPNRPAAKSFEETIPAYLRRPPLWKRVMPYAVVLILVGAFFGLIVTDEGLFPGLFSNDSANNSSGTSDTGKSFSGEQIAMNNTIGKTSTAKTAPNVSEKTSVSPMGKTPVSKTSSGTSIPSTKGIDQTPPPDKGGPGKKIVGTKPSTGVGKTPPVTVTPGKLPKTSPETSVPGTKPNPPAVVVNGPPLKYVTMAGQGLLFRRSGKETDWFAVPSQTMLQSNDRLVSTKPFDAMLDLNKGKTRITLTSGTSIQILPPTDAGWFSMELRHGRVVVRSQSTAEPNMAITTVFGLKVRGELWRVEMSSAQTVCGIEVTPRIAEGFEKDLDANTYTGKLFVLSGSVRLVNRDAMSVEITGDGNNCGYLSFSPDDRIAATTKLAANASMKQTPFGKISKALIPLWLSPAGRRPSDQVRRNSIYYLKEFEIDTQAARVTKISMQENVTAIVRDRRPSVAEFAVQALVATESYAELVQALVRTKHEEARQAAIDGLRKWLPTTVENKILLKIELRKIFPPLDAEAVYRLLWGVSDEDARNEKVSNQLVDWLAHDQDTIRQLAFSHIYRLTKRRYGYGVFINPSYRSIAITRWRTHLNKHGALLPGLPSKTKKQ